MRLRRIGRKIRVFANCLRASSARRPGQLPPVRASAPPPCSACARATQCGVTAPQRARTAGAHLAGPCGARARARATAACLRQPAPSQHRRLRHRVHMEAASCCAPLTGERSGERRMTRRTSRAAQLCLARPKLDADEASSLLATLPPELLLRVVRACAALARCALLRRAHGFALAHPARLLTLRAYPRTMRSRRVAPRRLASCCTTRRLRRRTPSTASPRAAPRTSPRWYALAGASRSTCAPPSRALCGARAASCSFKRGRRVAKRLRCVGAAPRLRHV
jgi:hypothetical protein